MTSWIWKLVTPWNWNQPQISSEALTSQQQINNAFDKTIVQNNRVVNIGCNVTGNQPVDIDKLDFTKLKEYYTTTLCQVSPLPWYPKYTWVIDEVYTELELQNSATSVFGEEELFKHAHEHFRKGGSYRILIEGDAGYGKSTLMLKIASDWSKRDSNDHTKYTSPFSVLFVVKLGYVGKNEKILSYMESIYNEKMGVKLKDVFKSKGAEEVLILLDGYDEANSNTKQEVGRIMVKEMMSKCHVVLTSRCGHVPDDVRHTSLLVTVKGFGRRQVTVAVGKFFIKARHLTKADVISCTVEPNHPPMPESLAYCNGPFLDGSDSDDEFINLFNQISFRDYKNLPSIDDFKNVQEITELLPVEERLSQGQFKEFMRKVEYESPYKELAQCPLLCVMMCCLVRECKNGELPSTCSGLYFAMINRNLCRAARKKAKAAGKEDVKWNWSVLDSRIRQGHESYLQKFGHLCIDGLKTGRMSFTLFDISGNEEEAKTSDVTPLIEAGVLVQDFTKFNTKENIPRYQVPHRTTAEFLAAYYLSAETDQNKFQQYILDLFRLRASFNEVAFSLMEMGKQRYVADAFRVIKFSPDCLVHLMKSYFTQHGAAGTWSEFKDVLPNELRNNFSTTSTFSGDYIVSSAEPSLTLFQLVEEFDKANIGETNSFRSLPKDCPISLHVKSGFKPRWFPILLQTLLKSDVDLNSLKYGGGSVECGISDQIRQELARSLQELLKAYSCPVQLSFNGGTGDLLRGVTEAMLEVPEACRLRSFEFLPEWQKADTSLLSKVLAEKWLSRLQHLGIGLWDCWGSGADTLNPILKRLTEPGCSLTSLHLCNYTRDPDDKGGLLLEDLMMLASKLETLKLENMHFTFDVTRTSKYATQEKTSLKSLHLKKISLSLNVLIPSADDNEKLLIALRNVALDLKELTIDFCKFPVELFSLLSKPNLRSLSIGAIYTNNYRRDTFCANRFLEALTRSSGDSIEDLSLLEDFWESSEVLMLHPIREGLQRCPRIKSVNLGLSEIPNDSPISIGPDPSTPLSSSDIEALKSKNIHLALFKIVLSVPKLQTLTSRTFFWYCEKIGTFRAIADKAEKWPEKRNDNESNTSLTLHSLSNLNACHAMQVFRERGLEYHLRYVTDEVYELWFPV